MGVKIGDKNKIMNSTIIGGSQINVAHQDKKALKEPFWRCVWQNIVSNAIWWGIGIIIIVAVGTIAAVKWDTIIELILGR